MDDDGGKVSILQRDIQEEKKVGLMVHPSATINGKAFRGDYKNAN